MGKAAKIKYHAVVKGHQGTKIYHDLWANIKHHVDGAPGEEHKGFDSMVAAQRWIDDAPARAASKRKPKASNRDQDATHVTVQTGDLPMSMDDPISSDHVTSNPQAPLELAQVLDDAPSVSLSDEQLDILERVRRGENVAYIGSAGTGKSVLIREIIKLSDPHTRELAITASTGAASVAFPGGRTLHSWAGVGQGAKSAELLLKEDITKAARKRIRQTKRLIIDELSMIDAELFDKIEYIVRRVKGNNKPFGGIQLVVSGDFCQLPPVPGPLKGKAKFAFEAGSWPYCFQIVLKLTRVFRQANEEFVYRLNEIKAGKVSAETAAVFTALARPVRYTDGIGPVELYPTKDEAKKANQIKLDDIRHPEVVFTGQEIGKGVDENNCPIPEDMQKEIRKRLAAPQELVLKKGAQVMLTRNKIQGILVNGSVGIIKNFCTIEEAINRRIFPFKVDSDEELERVEQSLPNICRDPSRDSGWTDRQYPLVRFPKGRTLFCHPVLFHQENRFGNLMAGRIQVPLIVAWALSIHKSQGATLERVKVDLEHVFERGQVYVALSRATNMESLQVLNFKPSKVEAHPYVLRWLGLEVDPRALEEEDWQRARALEAYKRNVKDWEEEDFHHDEIEPE